MEFDGQKFTLTPHEMEVSELPPEFDVSAAEALCSGLYKIAENMRREAVDLSDDWRNVSKGKARDKYSRSIQIDNIRHAGVRGLSEG
jgi:hypothetical protein